MNTKVVLIWLSIYAIACTSHEKTDTLLVRGSIENLPDGKMYLCERAVEIDSVDTKGGAFTFGMNKNDDFEPKYIQFVHISSSDSTRRVLLFKSKANYKSKPISTDRIMLEKDLTELIERIEDSEYGPKLMSSQFVGKQEFDPQSKVFLEDTIMFPALYTIDHLSGMLNKYPYSYHVLFEFKRFVPLLSNEKALAYLARFDSKLKNGTTGKQIERYIKSRLTRKLTETSLPDTTNVPQCILLPDKRLHLVILWASWCGPCRKEIPELKRVHQKFRNQELFDMVSISLDEKDKNWKTALAYEKMPWRQLIINDDVNTTYSKELFSFDGSIPTTLLVDSNGKIIKKIVGYDTASGKELEWLITSNLGIK